MVAQEVQGGLGKNTLGEVNLEAVISEYGEQLAQVREVGGEVRAGHQDIIQEDKKEGRP